MYIFILFISFFLMIEGMELEFSPSINVAEIAAYKVKLQALEQEQMASKNYIVDSETYIKGEMPQEISQITNYKSVKLKSLKELASDKIAALLLEKKITKEKCFNQPLDIQDLIKKSVITQNKALLFEAFQDTLPYIRTIEDV